MDIMFDFLLKPDLFYFIIGVFFSLLIQLFVGPAYVLFTKKWHAREKYAITDIMTYHVKGKSIPLVRLQLIKSSVKNACGFADLYKDDNKIVFRHYAFANNCFHNVCAPGTILFDGSISTATTESNEFDGITISYTYSLGSPDLLPKRFRKKSSASLSVRINYMFPPDYVGPPYKTKEFIFAKGIGLVSAVIVYNTDQTNVFELRRFKLQNHSSSWLPVESVGNWWEYDIEYFSGSANGPTKFNICEDKSPIPNL